MADRMAQGMDYEQEHSQPVFGGSGGGDAVMRHLFSSPQAHAQDQAHAQAHAQAQAQMGGQAQQMPGIQYAQQGIRAAQAPQSIHQAMATHSPATQNASSSGSGSN
ncbi:hypothetical protein IWW56_005112, partial [Coemansia sp. RSA 2131]